MSNTIKEKISSGALIVDVRSSLEFKEGHYKNAINIPVNEIENRISEFGSTSKVIIVYCASGGRSARAAKLLTEKGYTNVTNAGGLSDMPIV